MSQLALENPSEALSQLSKMYAFKKQESKRFEEKLKSVKNWKK